MTSPEVVREIADDQPGMPPRSPYALELVRKGSSPRTAEENRRIALWARYGMTLEEYDLMRALQEYRCAGCRRHEDEIERPNVGRRKLDGSLPELAAPLFVDHCHITGRIRQLLCNRCNLIVGFAADDDQVLEACADYVRSHAPNVMEVLRSFGPTPADWARGLARYYAPEGLRALAEDLLRDE